MGDPAELSTTAAVIGAGPAGLMAAETLGRAGVATIVFDQMPSPARKFLMAGRGGLNLTHSEPMDAFLRRYGDRARDIARVLSGFDPAALRAWADGLGADTFVGTSGRVFPRAMKASPLLRAWLRRLDALGLTLRLRHRWRGWTADGTLHFTTPEGDVVYRADVVILALGGASWPRLGSDGDWAALLAAKGVQLAPFRPANAGACIQWSAHVRERFAGAPVKNARFSLGDETVRGDAVVTAHGLEGGPLYALCARIRRRLDTGEPASLHIDFRPDDMVDALAARIAALPASASTSERLRRGARLSPVASALLRDAFPEGLSRHPPHLARQIKDACFGISALAPLERAISTAGGVPFEALDEALMAPALPGVFVAGEMLDWEAPTGGYLLQATMASGVYAARGALDWLKGRAIAPPSQRPKVATNKPAQEDTP